MLQWCFLIQSSPCLCSPYNIIFWVCKSKTDERFLKESCALIAGISPTMLSLMVPVLMPGVRRFSNTNQHFLSLFKQSLSVLLTETADGWSCPVIPPKLDNDSHVTAAQWSAVARHSWWRSTLISEAFVSENYCMF